MGVRINCGVKPCKAIFDDWQPYAKHILEKHNTDKERAEWAKNALAEVEVKEGK